MSIWDIVAGPLIAIVNKAVPDKTAAEAEVASFKSLVESGEQKVIQTQLDAVTGNQSNVDKVEAGSTSLFIAGWRPYVGWICGTALGLQLIVGPIFTWISALAGHPTPFPALDSKLLEGTLSGMLGLGFGLRTFEKATGIAGNH